MLRVPGLQAMVRGPSMLKFLWHPKLQELLKAIHLNLKIYETAMFSNMSFVQRNSLNKQEFPFILHYSQGQVL